MMTITCLLLTCCLIWHTSALSNTDDDLKSLIKKLAEKVDRVESEVHKIKNGLESDVHKIKKGLESDVHKMKMGLASEVHKMKMGLASEVHKMKKGLESEAHKMKKGLESEVHRMKKGIKSEVHKMKGLESEVHELKTDFESEVHKMNDLESEVHKMKKGLESEVHNMTIDLKELEEEHSEANKKIKGLDERLKQSKKDTSAQLATVNTKIEGQGTDITGIQGKLAVHLGKLSALERSINKSNEKIGSNTKTVGQLKEIITLVEGKLSPLGTDIKKNAGAISVVEGKQDGIKKSLENNTKELDALTEFVYQFNLHAKYRKDQVKLTFQQVLDLIGQRNLVDKTPPILQKLIHQFNKFEEDKAKLGITYDDVIRLMNPEDLQGAKHPHTLPKIMKLFDMFTDNFKSTWGVPFAEVIRLTTKEDMKVIEVPDSTYGAPEFPPVLEKIGWLYTEYDNSYKERWGVTFLDIVTLTEDLRFEVGDKDIPVFKLIGSWYVEKFTEVWGDSFHQFFDIMKVATVEHRAVLLEKVSNVASRDLFLKFLPATFTSKDDNLNVEGYVEVFVSVNTTGTIWNKATAGATAGNGENVLCRQGGYDAGDVATRKDDSFNRTSLNCLISRLSCFGEESKIQDCVLRYATVPWDHKDDLAIKCTF